LEKSRLWGRWLRKTMKTEREKKGKRIKHVLLTRKKKGGGKGNSRWGNLWGKKRGAHRGGEESGKVVQADCREKLLPGEVEILVRGDQNMGGVIQSDGGSGNAAMPKRQPRNFYWRLLQAGESGREGEVRRRD